MNLFILAALATFGLAALMSNYDGAFGVFSKLRQRFSVFRCTVCLSVWIVVPMLALAFMGEIFLLSAFAVIGAVIIVERLT